MDVMGGSAALLGVAGVSAIVTYVITRARAGAELARARAEAEKFRDQSESARAALAQRETELGQLRERVTRLTADEAARRAELEQHRVLESQLRDVFDSLCSQALRDNNDAFLQLAKQELERARSDARMDLEQREKAIAELLAPIRAGLNAYDAKLTEIEHARLHSFGQLAQSLQQVNASSEALKSETQHLIDALRTPAVRGQWGEFHLQRVCEMAGMLEHCDFIKQANVDTKDGKLRPDLVVQLAGGRRIVVDSKASMDAYLKAVDAKSDDERTEHLKRHAMQLRTQIDLLSRKAYWEQFDPTPEFVVLFIPGEAYFSAALQQDPALIEYGAERNVMLATPTTLITMLRTAALGWREASITKNAAEVRRLGKELYDRLAKLGDHFARIGKHLRNAVDAYNDALGSLESRVLVTARRLAAQDAFPADEIDVLAPVEVIPRAPQAQELLPAASPATGNGNGKPA